MTEVREGIGVRMYTDDELKKELDDFSFLKDAFLILLNEKVASKSDLPFSKNDVLKFAKEMYDDSEYSQDFINECFK
jgi:hypothetical protein